MKRILAFLTTALIFASCLPQNTRLPQSPLLSVLERKSGMIAYVGIDGNIYVSDQGGGNKTAFTNDAVIPESQSAPFLYYQYPTWSADSNKLAFVGISGQGGTASGSTLHVADMEEEKAKKLFSSETENPIYLYWSPDNENIGFLSSAASGQSFLLQNISIDGKRTVLDTGSPYYWSWAPDGSVMIVHAGEAASAIPVRLSFLQLGDEIIEDQLDTVPASFQAPAWSPDGKHILLSRVNEQNENEIILTDSRGRFESVIGGYDVNTAFVWSYDSELVAYIDGQTPMTAGAVGTLHVVDTTNSEDFFQDEGVLAAFWSPNSKKLLYFKPAVPESSSGEGGDSTGQQFYLSLFMLDVNSAESRELFTFQPTNPFASMLFYFDQYHQSNTIWSPDNNNIVLSFLTSDGAPGIAIVAASGQMEPRVLDQGYIAYWSWK
ncbi:MAG: PD40 domain-containing protein [Chloroflexi bacterium]|nr:PD40 domain-containing protein [Chloroflexota bacterium]